MSTPRILIVDDSLTIRRALELILKPKGYALEFAVDGAEALARAASFSPDLILLDYVLPDMRGPDVCAALSGTPASAQTPVILVSAKGASIRQAYQDAQNVVSYITKPFKPAVVQAVVENALARSRGAAPVAAEPHESPAEPSAPVETVPEAPLPASVEDTFSRLLAQLEDAAAADLRPATNGHLAKAPLGDLLPTLERVAAHFGDVSGHLEALGVAPYRLRADGSFASIAATLLAAHRALCEAAIALAVARAPGATPLPPPVVVLACPRAHPRYAEAVAAAVKGSAVLCGDEDFTALPHLLRLLTPRVVLAAAGDPAIDAALRVASECAPPGLRFVLLAAGAADELPAWAAEKVDGAQGLDAFVDELARPLPAHSSESLEVSLDVVTL